MKVKMSIKKSPELEERGGRSESFGAAGGRTAAGGTEGGSCVPGRMQRPERKDRQVRREPGACPQRVTRAVRLFTGVGWGEMQKNEHQDNNGGFGSDYAAALETRYLERTVPNFCLPHLHPVF